MEFDNKQDMTSEPKQRHQCRFRRHGDKFKNDRYGIAKFNCTSSGTLALIG